MRHADEHGNWAYTAFWSDATLTIMLDTVVGFRAEVYALIEHAVSCKKLRPIGNFVSAVTRALLNCGDPDGLKFMKQIRTEDTVVRSVDGSTGWDLLDVALSSFSRCDEAGDLWLERIDSSPSDAYVLANCEQLVQGGNREWLLRQSERDLGSAAPYYRRRGMLLLAGAGGSKADLDAAVVSLGDGIAGLEDAQRTATNYIDRVSQMRHWITATLLATSAGQAICAATLLFHCADSRVWSLLDEAVDVHGAPRCGAPLTQLFPSHDLRTAVKETLKQRDKFLLGFQRVQGDAAPWLTSEAKASLRLPI